MIWHEACQKLMIRHKVLNRILQRFRIFREKLFRPHFRVPCTLSFCQKSGKTNEAILHKVQKTLFLGGFWTKFAQKKFFSKIGLRHILGIAILHLCAKNQQKLMSQSREKLVTDGRTNGQRLIYRTSKVGPKIKGFWKNYKLCHKLLEIYL